MPEDNIVQKIKRWKPMSKQPIRRPKTHWEDNFLGDEYESKQLEKVSQNRDRLEKVVDRARTLHKL
jgi:hypothetical protein